MSDRTGAGPGYVWHSFVSGLGFGLLLGWALGVFAVPPPGGWPQWAFVALGLSLALVPGYLLNRRVDRRRDNGGDS